MKIVNLVVLVLLISVSYIKAQGEAEVIDEKVEVIPEGGDGTPLPEGGATEPPAEEEKPEPEPEPEPQDPCVGVECGYGKHCVASAEGKGECKCFQSCRHMSGYGPRFQVCSNQNETFPNLCDMEKEKCMCESGEQGCQDPKHKTVELQYYGQCRGPQECPEDVLAEFAVRIVAWLGNVLMSMAGMQEISRSEVMMAREASQPERANVTPVLWKFCDLDKEPSDGQISQRELLPLMAQLYPLEDCADTFFKKCDGDSNKDISLKEFGKCMGLAEGDIKDRCKEIVVDETEPGSPEPAFLKEKEGNAK